MNEQITTQNLPLAKRSDPWTSDKAGEEHNRSGRMATQRVRVLRALQQHGPATGAELGLLMGGDRYAAHRRLAELERMDLVERIGFRFCEVTHRKCQLWRAVRKETLFSTSEY